MCKPSSSSHSNARTADLVGAVVVAVIVLAVIGTVGPAVTAVAHVAFEVVKLTAIGIGFGAMIGAVTWLAMHILRAATLARPVPQIRLTARQDPARLKPVSEQVCLTCGDKGRIIRAIGNGSAIQLRPCPDCQPAQLIR